MTVTYKRYICLLCGWIYDEAKGSPEDNLPPFTRWEDIPMTWRCPDCGASKADFEMEEI
jgi:rubredoxin